MMLLKDLKPKDFEKFIGIECYITSSNGIGGIIKERPEDFMVWEVIRNGLNAKTCYDGGLRTTLLKDRFAMLVLHKINVPTFIAIHKISKLFKVMSKDIGICGIKDKRAMTWQFLSIPESCMKNFNDALIKVMDRVWIKHIGYVNQKLSAQNLLRNEFKVKVSRVALSKDCIESLIEKVLEEITLKGLPNFFGHQRFGVLRPITHIVGKYIIQGRLDVAVEEFLFDYSQFEPKHVRMLRKELAEARNLSSVANNLPSSLSYERSMLLHLIKNPKDYVGALRRLPLRLRRLFVEAYASYLFNKLLSRMLKMGVSLRMPEAGDLVVPLDMHGLQNGKPFYISQSAVERAKELIEQSKIAIVLPVPGWRVILPHNYKASILNDILEEEGIKLSDFKCHQLPEVSTMGDYRSVTINSYSIKSIEVSDGNVNMELSLMRGAYATVLLREIMKAEYVLNYEGIQSTASKNFSHLDGIGDHDGID